jgi:hypothetical protein
MKQVGIVLLVDWCRTRVADVPTFIDKEYRKGVHWLETLRLRRMKILEAGYMV